MTIAELLDRLGYATSENYLREDTGDFNRVVDYGHLFRRAAKEPCRLRGVYGLKDPKGSAIPVTYVCEATSEADAKEVHRLVWNQDTVPFLVVCSPETVRLYPGFCRAGATGGRPAITAIQRAFEAADLEQIAKTLHASSVDAGHTWDAWGRHIRPEYRVDWRLLGNLRKLDEWLQRQGGLARDVSHGLIGKYVYLHYLRDRDILSRRKLDGWRIDSTAVFGRDATREGLQALLAKLDDWLNGEVFPIDFARCGAPRDEHVCRVAATFQGDQPLGADQWQLHLDFRAYDFSYIPIEILSIVYEQFLQVPGDDGGKSRRRSAGAYYTPIPVVNLMLSELEERRPLRRGMRVFDPACGSGAFLVQAFRRLIEKEFPPEHGHASPVELRKLLESHFYGLDTDEDACRVTKLSLILTLLDYVDPPDPPRLPNLRENITCGNFFDEDADWQRLFARKKADWVVGNPPWKQLTSKSMRPEDEPVLAWMKAEEERRPVGNRQMARAFAWRAAEYVGDTGEVALFLPAMTLFEEAAKRFRSRFLEDMAVHTIANFSNLRWVISGRRFTAPAAAFFYRPRPADPTGAETIRMYSPLVANQEATRPVLERKRNESWTIVTNASEIRDVPLTAVADGGGLPWKIASWGSDFDAKLIRSVRRRFDTIGEMEKHRSILLSEGLQLRAMDASEDIERISLPREAKTVDLSVLRGARDFFALPEQALTQIPTQLRCVRKGRANLPMSVSEPPHLILSAARNFAVYSEDFIIVPPRQIGIVSPSNDSDLLKALSVFLSSDFAFYYEFFLSTELGVERDRSTLGTLRMIPTPLTEVSKSDLRDWARLHDRLADVTRQACQSSSLWQDGGPRPIVGQRSVVGDDMVAEMNALVNGALGLGPKEKVLIKDLVRVRFALNDGRLGDEAVRHPTKPEVQTYATRLQAELDDYIHGELPGRHDVGVLYDDHSGMVRVSLDQRAAVTRPVSVVRAGAAEAAALEQCRGRLRRMRSQWVYFDRNLRVYDGDNTYVLKPMQRFQWTETQARVDATSIVSESIARRGRT